MSRTPYRKVRGNRELLSSIATGQQHIVRVRRESPTASPFGSHRMEEQVLEGRYITYKNTLRDFLIETYGHGNFQITVCSQLDPIIYPNQLCLNHPRR